MSFNHVHPSRRTRIRPGAYLLMALAATCVSCDSVDLSAIADARILVTSANSVLDRPVIESDDALNDQAEQAERRDALGDLKAARDLYTQARADRSNDPELLAEFAELTVRTKDYDLAGQAFQRAAELSPENAEYWLEAGRNFVRAGAGLAEEARIALITSRDIAERSGDDQLAARANTQLGHLHRQLGLYDFAREHYDAGLTTELRFYDALLGLAGLNFREGRVAEAAETFEALGMSQGVDQMFLEEMLRFGYEGFRENRISFEDNGANHLGYAKLLTRLQLVHQALPAAQRAAELDDQNVVALNLLGSLARVVGNTALAVSTFEQSLRVQPDQTRTREVLDALRNSQTTDQ